MGGKSKSKSSSSSNSGYNTDTLQSQGASQQANQMNSAFGFNKMLQDSQLGQIMPAFGEMVKGGTDMMNGNVAQQFMGSMMGLPIQMETPDFISSFVDKYKPQEPAQPTAAPQGPAYNINDDMRNRMGAPSPYGQYGPYGHQRTSMFGGK